MTKSKANIFILLTVVVCFLFSNTILTNIQSLEFNEKNQIQINQSGFWDLTGAPIYIDDSATGVGAHNWTWAVSQPWCSGSGSWADHYVIEDVTINGQSSDNCIEIKNSDAYFIIRNCLLSNSGPYTDACLVLDNVNNGKIKNNTCSDNPRSGIRLVYSHNNTISGNTANNNNNGLYLVHSHNNFLSGNTASKDPVVAINDFHGIVLSNSNNNNLSCNLMYFCGITLSGSLGGMVSNNIDNTNLVNNKPIYYYVNEVSLGSSNFTEAGQLILINCSNSIISGLNLSNSTTGIYLGYSHNNTLSGNTVSNNNYYGIHLYESGNNSLLGNTASNNYRGIFLSNCDDNTLSGNTASNNNYEGIRLVYSHNNTLSGNTASNNNYYGIRLSSSYYNILSGNTANSNFNAGIRLMACRESILSNNLMYFCGISLSGLLVEITSHSIDETNLVNNKPVYYYVNELSLGSRNFTNAGQIILINCNNSIISGLNLSNGSKGIYLVYSNNNNVSGNTACNNEHGIFLFNCDNNTLSENFINNNHDGIHLGESNNNKLSGNIVNNNHDGMFLTHSNNNNIFLNYFNNNEFNAADNGINNKWDNGTIGNYWDDYWFIDENRDGIGDRPYIIPGSARSQDNFPIWPDIDEELDDELIISFGNYYILFMLITILSFILLEKQKTKLKN